MIRLFLKAKHWQLFILMLGIPLIYQFHLISQISVFQTDQEPISIGDGFTEVLNETFITLDFFPYAMIFFTLIFFGWFWSIAIGLQKNIPKDIKMKIEKFKVLFFIPLIYIILTMIYLGGLSFGMPTNVFSNSSWLVVIILPLHLFSMFCVFYSMYFVAKTIKTAELQRNVEFRDFAKEFFLLWFYIIGIWFIQPKLNKLSRKVNSTPNKELS